MIKKEILRLFGIRQKIWKGEPISEKDQPRWELARLQVPDWPLFKRLELSDDERLAQAEAEQAAEKEWEAFLSEADEVIINEEDGIDTISATFKLSDEREAGARKRSWWQRILHKLNLSRK